MNARRITGLILIAGLLAGTAWWFWPAPSVQEKPQLARLQPTPTVNEAALTDAPPPDVEPLATNVPAAVSVDPQANLSTAIPDMIQILANQGTLAFMQKYMPPDQLAQMTTEEQTSLMPQVQARVQVILTELLLIGLSSPTYNATGDEATYTLTDSVSVADNGGQVRNLKLIKLNGRWYIEN